MVGSVGNILSPTLAKQLIAIQRSQRAVDNTTLRLATGLKVNSALENPASFFEAKDLQNRAKDLTRLKDQITTSLRTIETAENGVKGILKLLDQAEAVVKETQTELASGLAYPDLSFVQEESEIIEQAPFLSDLIIADAPIAYYRLNETAGITAVNSTPTPGVFDGTYQGPVRDAAPLYQNGSNPSASFDGVNDRVLLPDGRINTIPTTARTVELVFSADDTTGRRILYEEGDQNNGFAIYIDNGTLYFTGEDNSGVNTFVDLNVNAAVSAGQTYHAAFVFDSANLTFEGFLDGQSVGTAAVNNEAFPNHSSGGIAIGGMNNGVQFHDGSNSNAAGFNFDGRISDVAVYNSVLSQGQLQAHADSLNLGQTVEYTHTEYDLIIEQINLLVEDAGYRGINLLNSENLVTFFNEDRSNSLFTEGVDFSYEGLGLTRYDFNDTNDLDAILDDIENARNTVRSFGRSLASDLNIIKTRDSFIRSTINTLLAGSDDLTVADQNEEGANLLALQTRQQIQFATLSLASQAQANVIV